eukprot:6176545-Pleurochrysis_carterae.AAC.2
MPVLVVLALMPCVSLALTHGKPASSMEAELLHPAVTSLRHEHETVVLIDRRLGGQVQLTDSLANLTNHAQSSARLRHKL